MERESAALIAVAAIIAFSAIGTLIVIVIALKTENNEYEKHNRNKSE